MSAMRNLKETLPGGRPIMDRPTPGVYAAAILTETAAGVNDTGPGRLRDVAIAHPTAYIAARVNWSEIPAHLYDFKMNGGLAVRAYGRLRYTVYVDNISQPE